MTPPAPTSHRLVAILRSPGLMALGLVVASWAPIVAVWQVVA